LVSRDIHGSHETQLCTNDKNFFTLKSQASLHLRLDTLICASWLQFSVAKIF
jgi:hypothetical protein